MTKIKIPKKKTSSNKDKTFGENIAGADDPSLVQSHLNPEAIIPFIDRISVTLKVPAVDDAAAIHGNIWAQFDDVAVFQSAKKGKSYRIAKRIKLPSVIDAAKWPFFQYNYDDGMATGLRIEFIPADIGHQGMLELHSVLTSLIPNGWAYFIEHGRITRIDIALDIPTARMEEFHFLPTQGATTSVWRSNGKLQTFQHGQPKGNHTQIYNRKAKRIAQGKSWKGKEGIRIERRLKGQQLALQALPGLPNPFASMALIERYPSQPPTEKKEYVWALFLNAAEYMGIPAALALLPEERRTAYRAHLKTEKLKWWDADAIWKNWSVTVDGLEISTLKSWS